jgi:hypothetical protein
LRVELASLDLHAFDTANGSSSDCVGQRVGLKLSIKEVEAYPAPLLALLA